MEVRPRELAGAGLLIVVLFALMLLIVVAALPH
jgi:hypothetical protein